MLYPYTGPARSVRCVSVRFTTALTADTTFIWTALPPRDLRTSVLLLTGSKAALLHPCYPRRAATPGLGLPPPFQMPDGMAASLSPRTVAPASGTKHGWLSYALPDRYTLSPLLHRLSCMVSPLLHQELSSCPSPHAHHRSVQFQDNPPGPQVGTALRPSSEDEPPILIPNRGAI